MIFRLLVNQTLLGGSPLGHPLFNWILYGYGLPCLAFALAARLSCSGGGATTPWSPSWRPARCFFLTLLVTFEIRSLFNAGDAGRPQL